MQDHLQYSQDRQAWSDQEDGNERVGPDRSDRPNQASKPPPDPRPVARRARSENQPQPLDHQPNRDRQPRHQSRCPRSLGSRTPRRPQRAPRRQQRRRRRPPPHAEPFRRTNDLAPEPPDEQHGRGEDPARTDLPTARTTSPSGPRLALRHRGPHRTPPRRPRRDRRHRRSGRVRNHDPPRRLRHRRAGRDRHDLRPRRTPRARAPFRRRRRVTAAHRASSVLTCSGIDGRCPWSYDESDSHSAALEN